MATYPITVVITVKNNAKFLRETLRSFATQSFADWQMIIVDDYSDEDIATVVAEFNDPRFRLVKNTGKAGKSAARNFGNSLAESEWIVVADADDINLPREMEVISESITSHPEADIFYCRFYMFEDGTYEFKPTKRHQPVSREQLYKEGGISHAGLTYRKTEWEKSGGYDEELHSAEDYNLILSFADRHLSFYFISEPLYLYRRYATQTTREPASRTQMFINADLVRERHAANL